MFHRPASCSDLNQRQFLGRKIGSHVLCNSGVDFSQCVAFGSMSGKKASSPTSPSSAHPPPGMPPELAELRSTWMKEQRALAKQVVLDDRQSGFEMPWETIERKKREEVRQLPIAIPSPVANPTLSGKWAKPPPTVTQASPTKQQDTTPPPTPSNSSGPLPLTRIGGVDISFVKDTSIAVASLVVLDFPSFKVRRTLMHHCEMKLPYMAGFLAFREVEPLQYLISKIREDYPDDVPQIIFVDGNGVLHFRRCGLASHLGVVCDIPCVGSAKKLLAVDGLVPEELEAELENRKSAANELMPLRGKTGDLLGYACLTGKDVFHPIFISAGHRISQESAARLVRSMCPTRIPEPIRQADLLSREYIRNWGKDGIDTSEGATVEVQVQAISTKVEDDWRCPKCHFHNFARHLVCRRCDLSHQSVIDRQEARVAKNREATAAKDSDARKPKRRLGDHEPSRNASSTTASPSEASSAPPSTADWNCASCAASNFARRARCRQCNAMRSGATASAEHHANLQWPTSRRPTTSGQKCSKCGFRNDSNDSKCRRCGKLTC